MLADLHHRIDEMCARVGISRVRLSRYAKAATGAMIEIPPIQECPGCVGR
jgi:hypothetical protein